MEDWGYARVSSEEQQADKGALRKQVERLRSAGCVKIFWDIQSRSTEVREGLQELINELKAAPIGKVRSLKFTRIDRIGSSSRLFYSLLEVLRSKGVKLVALDQGIDPDTLGGELTIDMLLAAAKFEIGMVTQRLKSERLHRKNQGKSHRIAPFGYRIENDRYYRDDTPCVCLIEKKLSFTKAELVRYLFDTFFEEGSIAQTCRKFHEEFGIHTKVNEWEKDERSKTISDEDLEDINFSPTKKNHPRRYPWTGLHFTTVGMRNLLVSPIYAGGTLYDTFTGTRRKRKHFDAWNVKWDTHTEVIITREEHEKAKSIIRSNRNNKWSTKTNYSINPFANILKCAHCGAAMVRHSKRITEKYGVVYSYLCRRYKTEGCTNKHTVNSRKMEQQVVKMLVAEAQRLADAVIIEDDTPAEESPELKALRESLATLESLPFNPTIEDAKEGIRLQIGIMVAQASRKKPVSLDWVISGFSDPDYWLGLSPNDKKRALAECIKRILVDGREVVRIEYL